MVPPAKHGTNMELMKRLCVFCFQQTKTTCTKTTIKQLTDVLHLVQLQPDGMALTFSTAVRLTLYSCATAVTWDKFVFGHIQRYSKSKIGDTKKGQKSTAPCILNAITDYRLWMYLKLICLD
jgi:hypothetical protein